MNPTESFDIHSAPNLGSFLIRLFTADFMPHGHCYFWRPDILWTGVISDSIIALSYYSIPLALLYLVRKRRDLVFHWIFIMFAVFILACGTTHVMGIWTVWHGTYRLDVAVKLFTAIVSIVTAIVLWPLIPKLLALPSPKQLEQANDALRNEIQERKKLQEAMIQSEKMSAVGQLAGGVAHEINNPLAVILGFSQGLARRLKPGDPNEEPIRAIEEEAKRCKQLVQDLLTFSRVGKTEKEKIDLNETINGALSLVIARSKVKSVDLVKELEEGLPPVLVNLNQIQQVIVNLGNNAIDAMPEGGKLTVRTRKASEAGKDFIEIQIQDTGKGISREAQARIFEPFFTTKEAGQGTGLGLSLVYEIIQKHDGQIRVESRGGQGTTFFISLPVRPNL